MSFLENLGLLLSELTVDCMAALTSPQATLIISHTLSTCMCAWGEGKLVSHDRVQGKLVSHDYTWGGAADIT